ncbi:hypothetical protein E1091_02930 [Micromonospora fluostatini]|uniref:Competence protein CoiA nuclease-like domain-containing protein n=1 Tax=Micromonospora fluostatini TaxID=1629071 RepID=A0ABY2DKP0_9ACTN|nr:hypothetical protein E1091_02930 [Micromonospora fluostatini]
MTRYFRGDVDPGGWNDGILYLPAMLEIQPRLPQWGHPGEPGLRDRIANDRPQGIGGQKLICLLCMRIRAKKGGDPEPVWMTFVEGRHGPMFRHEDGRSPHAEHQPETDTHKALKERKARTFTTAGAEVELEVWRPRARRRPDVLAVGPELTVAGEIQHSVERPRVIQNRQRSLSKAGDRVVWTTDRGADGVAFLYTVPHLSIPAMADYRQYLSQEHLEVGAGALGTEEQLCGWDDMWTQSMRCPVTRKRIPCGKKHLYPSQNIHAYQRRADGVDARFPCGPRLHLDHLLEGILRGAWLPYQARARVFWLPAADHERIVEERGGGVEQAESGTVARRDRTGRRTCENGAPMAPAETEDVTAEVEVAAVCCGERLPSNPGGTPLPACQLCPKSPTYYGRNRP